MLEERNIRWAAPEGQKSQCKHGLATKIQHSIYDGYTLTSLIEKIPYHIHYVLDISCMGTLAIDSMVIIS